jgi:hypothetical protein
MNSNFIYIYEFSFEAITHSISKPEWENKKISFEYNFNN